MFKLVQKLKPKHFKEMAAIERCYYSNDFITDWQDAYDWYVFSEDTCVAVAENDRVVAFMNLFPISERFFQLIYNGESHDGYLELSDVLRIRDEINGSYSLFLSCLAVHPDYRRSKALDLVIREYASRYIAHRNNGAELRQVITHNVTVDGERFSHRMGLEKRLDLDNKSTIAVATFDEFIRRMIERGGV